MQDSRDTLIHFLIILSEWETLQTNDICSVSYIQTNKQQYRYYMLQRYLYVCCCMCWKNCILATGIIKFPYEL